MTVRSNLDGIYAEADLKLMNKQRENRKKCSPRKKSQDKAKRDIIGSFYNEELYPGE